MKRVLIDTGPLVAILSKVDHHHASCVETLRHLPAPLLSCWPVMTEAAWLLRAHPKAVQQLLRGVEAGFLELLPLHGNEAKGIAKVMKSYENIGSQLADAALVYLANRENIDTIFTLDRRDFSVYRSARKRPFVIVPRY